MGKGNNLQGMHNFIYNLTGTSLNKIFIKSPLIFKYRLKCLFKKTFIIPKIGKLHFAYNSKQAEGKYKSHKILKTNIVQHMMHVLTGYCFTLKDCHFFFQRSEPNHR